MSEQTIQTCKHIKIDGQPCGSPALRDLDYCHFHEQFYDLNHMPGSPDYEPPVLEDALSVQLFITQITKALLCGSISPLQANHLLTLARAAMQNLRLAKAK
jgi:hypothetical protein